MSQRGSKLSGEDAAGKPLQDPPSPHKLNSLQDILDLVFSLSDEEWRNLTSDVPLTVTKAQFVSLCTNIIGSVTKLAIQSYLTTMYPVVEMEAALMAEEVLRKEAASDTINPSGNGSPRSGSSAGGTQQAPFKLLERVRGYLQAFFKTSLEDQQVPDSQTRNDMDLDKLTVKCTNSIISEIVRLSRSDSTIECPADEAPVETCEVFQGLEELVRNLSGRDLGEHKDTAVQTRTSLCSVESLFTAHFQNKATQTVSGILLRTVDELSASGSSQSVLDSSPTANQPSTAPTYISIEVQSTASNIVKSCLKCVYCMSFGSDHSLSGATSKPKETASSASHTIYRRVHKKVFGFLLGLQRNKVSTQEEEKKSPQLIPRVQLNIDSCTGEVIGNVVELYRSELLLSSPPKAPLRCSTSLPQQSFFKLKTVKTEDFLTEAAKIVNNALVKEVSSTDTSRTKDLQETAVTIAETVVDAIDRYIESKLSAAATVDSRCEVLSCLDALSHISVSDIPDEHEPSENMTYSSPFFVFRRVKDLLTNCFMDADRVTEKDTSMTLIDLEHYSDTVSSAGPQTSSDLTTLTSSLGVVPPSVDVDDGEMPGTSAGTEGQDRLSDKSSGSPAAASPTTSDKASPVNPNPAVNPDPEPVKTRRLGFQFIVGKRSPVIRLRSKKLCKVAPAATVSVDPQPALPPEKASLTESQDLGTPFKTTRRRLSRIFSAIRRVLPNPFTCMTGPS